MAAGGQKLIAAHVALFGSKVPLSVASPVHDCINAWLSLNDQLERNEKRGHQSHRQNVAMLRCDDRFADGKLGLFRGLQGLAVVVQSFQTCWVCHDVLVVGHVSHRTLQISLEGGKSG